MRYESLLSIYYKRPSEWEQEYNARFNNLFTKHLPINIHQYNLKRRHQAFYCYTEESALLQDKIMSEFSGLQHILRSIPRVGIEQFLNSCLVSEIQSSNDIEGVYSTRKEIRTALLATPEERLQMRLGGIVGKYTKIIYGTPLELVSCQDVRTLFDDLLSAEIGRSNPELLPDGRLFRASSVDIVTPTQKITHQGIYPEEKIIQYMDKALIILHDQTIPYFNRVAIFHFLFGYIHPFYDGNGRMSRFITSCLLSDSLHPTVALQLSVMLKKQRQKYYRLFLDTEADINKGDLTPFIIGTLKFIFAAIAYTKDILSNKLESYKQYQTKIRALEIGDATTKAIYDVLLQAAIFSDIGATSNEIRLTIGKAENTVATRLKQIPPHQLKCVKTSRPYHYSLNLSAFNDD